MTLYKDRLSRKKGYMGFVEELGKEQPWIVLQDKANMKEWRLRRRIRRRFNRMWRRSADSVGRV